MANRIRWRLLRFVDALAGTLFVASGFLVSVLVGFVFEHVASGLVESPWPQIASFLVGSIGALVFVLFAAKPAQWCRGLLRESFLQRARAAAKERVEALVSGRASNLRIVLFLHGFDAEASARAQKSKARDLEVFRVLESYFANRLSLFWLWPVVRVLRAAWVRLPVWRSIDEYLTEALWPEYLVVSVGGRANKLGVFGAEPISESNESWRERVARLAEVASALVVVPGPTGGVTEEIKLVASSASLQSKAVFVWPANGRSASRIVCRRQ